jgi:hypothetical protein
MSTARERHFVGQPAGPAGFLQFGAQEPIDVAQIGDIGDRIFSLGRQKRTPRPIREARGFIEPDFRDGLNKIAIGDLIAEAADHRGDLGIEQRRRDQFCKIPNNFKILTSRMKDFRRLLVGHQLEKGRKIQPFGHRIDSHGFFFRRELHEAETRPEGRFPQKFGIDGDEGLGRKAAADGA